MDNLLISKDERGVATLTLNRPERHNAFDDALVAQITQVLRHLESDETVRVLVLRGAGKSFSAGGDIAWLLRMAGASYAENLRDAEALADMMRRLYAFPKPTLALIHGAAYGGGVGLAACCDIVLATERASFCLSEARIGIAPAAIGPYVIRAVGPRQARRLMLTGETISAARAREIGLAHEIVADEEAEALLEKTLDALLRCAPGAQSAVKQFVALCVERPLDEELSRDSARLLARLRSGDEGRDGLTAFLERRAPNWIERGSDDDVS